MPAILRKYEVLCKNRIVFIKPFNYGAEEKEKAIQYAKEYANRGYIVEVYKCVLKQLGRDCYWIKYEIYSNKERVWTI